MKVSLCIIHALLLFPTSLGAVESERVLRVMQESGKGKGCKSKSSTSPSKDVGVCKVVDQVETENLVVSEINTPGFGDLNNKYALGMTTFGDYVYVGTLNAPGFPQDLVPWFLGDPLETTGAKVYRGQPRCDDGEWEWEQVLDFGRGGRSITNFGIRKMIVVEDYLYFVTANHEDGLEVWATEDGETWIQKSLPGFDSDGNISGRSLAECGGYLYVGTENRNTGAQLWRHDLSSNGFITGSDWEQIINDGFGNGSNFFISELTQFEPQPNTLYAGTLNGFDGMELHKIMECNAATPAIQEVFTGGWPTGPVPCPFPILPIQQVPINLCTTNSGALTLQTAETNLGPALFLGTVNYFLGASLFVTLDGMNFFPVYLFGNGDFRQSYVWSIEEYKGRLYFGTFQRPNLINFIKDTFTGANDLVMTPAFVLEPSMNLPLLPPSMLVPPGLDNVLNAVVDSGDFSLLSLDLNGFGLNRFPSVVKETDDAFGSCYPYGVRTMVKYEDSLILGSAGASSDGGTLIFEAKHLECSSSSGKGKSRKGKSGKGKSGKGKSGKGSCKKAKGGSKGSKGLKRE